MFKRFDLNCGEEIRSKKSVIRSFETFLTLRFFFFFTHQNFRWKLFTREPDSYREEIENSSRYRPSIIPRDQQRLYRA